VRALNVEWTAGALPAWEIVLTWRNGHDPWHELLHAMQLSDPIPFDLTPMIFFLAQHALLPDGPQRAQAWAPHVQFYELGMMNLVMALIHEWAAVDERRAHIEAISQVVLDPELAKKAGICRTLLLALGRGSQRHPRDRRRWPRRGAAQDLRAAGPAGLEHPHGQHNRGRAA